MSKENPWVLDGVVVPPMDPEVLRLLEQSAALKSG